MARDFRDIAALNTQVAQKQSLQPGAQSISVQIDPKTREINIVAPQVFIDSPEFQQQILPEFQKLTGRHIDDNQFKAIMNSGTIEQLEKASDDLLKRFSAIAEYKNLYPKASDNDALLYFQNKAAGSQFKDNKDVQIAVGVDDGGKPIYESVKSLTERFGAMADSEKANMLKSAKEISEKGTLNGVTVSETNRAAAMGTLEFLAEQKLTKAKGATKINEGLNAWLAKADNNVAGWAFGQLSRLGDLSGEGPKFQTAAEVARDNMGNNDALTNLSGVSEARAIGTGAAELTGIASDIAATAGLGAPAVLARVPKVGSLINTLKTPGVVPGGKVIAGTIQQVPADIAYGLAHSATNGEYDGVQDFALNTVMNAAVLGGARGAGNLIKSVDTASNGTLSRISDEVSKFGLRGVQKVQDIKFLGDIQKRLSVNILDESAAVKRSYRNAYANAKGAEATKAAKSDYMEINNLIRNASQKGAPQAREFRVSTPEFQTALGTSLQFRKAGPEAAQDAITYVNKKTILDRANAGQYKMDDIAKENLEIEVRLLEEKNPDLETYRQQVAEATTRVVDMSSRAGILDEDLIAYMRDNPTFADDYIELQYDLTSTKNPFTGRGSTKNMKNTSPIKRIKGVTDGDMLDPMLVLNQRLEVTTRLIAENGVNSKIAESVSKGLLPGFVRTDAVAAKRLSDLKFSREIEKESVQAALGTQLDELGRNLNALVDDIEDFAGSGQVILSERIDVALNTMTDVILDNPQLEGEIAKIVDDLDSTTEGVQVAAAAGILKRQSAEVTKTLQTALLDSPLGKEERDQVIAMFKDKISQRFDDAMTGNGVEADMATAITKERSEEIKQLRRDMGTIKENNSKDTIAYYQDGHKGYVQLDDPDLADYFNSRKTPTEDGLVARAMTGVSRVFRFGTTAAEPIFSLFVNPIRDFPQAAVTSGPRVLAPLSPEKMITDLMEVKGISRVDADAIIKNLNLQTENNFRMATQTSVARGDVSDGSKRRLFDSAEDAIARQDKAAYNNMQRESRDYTRGKSKYVINALVPTRAIRNAEDLLSEVEVATRKQVTNARFQSALQRGLSVEDATTEALFYGSESTANFLNIGAKTRQYVRTMPYLTAAINGSASFTRLFALDPVGVGMRLFGGAVTPIMFLAANNMSTPEKQAQYSIIPEYVKRSNIVILTDGTSDPILIPLSYDLARFANPFVDIVEKLHDQDNETFTNIFAKGLLSMSPVDLSGFATQDANGDVNVGQAASQALSSVTPQAVKPIIASVTGNDPYFGTELNPSDNDLYRKDQLGEDGELTAGDRTFSSRDSKTLRAIADATGMDQGKVQNLVSSYTGTVGQYALNVLDKLTGAPESQQGGKELAQTLAKRFSLNLDSGGTATTDYYAMIDDLEKKKEGLMNRLEGMSNRAYFNGEDDESVNEKRQKLIDAYGEEVSARVNKFGEFYNRIGGLKPYQLDAVVDLFDLIDVTGALDSGSYQANELQEAKNESANIAKQRYSDVGMPTTNMRDIFGKTTMNDDGEFVTDYGKTTMTTDIFARRIQGAPRQIAFEMEQLTKADKKAGILSLYEEKEAFAKQIDKLFEEAAGLKGKAATAKYSEISDMQERYMTEIFDPRIRPLIEKYGVEILRNSKVLDEIETYIMVPGDYTPFSSRKKQPYLKDDVDAYLKDRYGVGNINQRNLQNDQQAVDTLNRVNKDIAQGRAAAANYKLSALQQDIEAGKTYVDVQTMEQIEKMIAAANKRR